MRTLTLCLTLLAASACKPGGIADCDCEAGELCRTLHDDGDTCIEIPAACEPAFGGDCADLPDPDAACRAAVCGADVPSWERQCFSGGDGERPMLPVPADSGLP